MKGGRLPNNQTAHEVRLLLDAGLSRSEIAGSLNRKAKRDPAFDA